MWPQILCQTILRVIRVPIRCPPDAHESSSSPADRATASPGLGQAGKSLRLAGSQENRFVLQDCLTSKAKCDTDLGGGCGAHPTSDRGPRHTDAPSRRSERAALSSSESASYRPARSSAMLNTGQDGQNLTNRGLRQCGRSCRLPFRWLGWHRWRATTPRVRSSNRTSARSAGSFRRQRRGNLSCTAAPAPHDRG